MENSSFDLIGEKSKIEKEEVDQIFATFKRTDGQITQKERLKKWQMNQVYLKQVQQNRPMFEDDVKITGEMVDKSLDWCMLHMKLSLSLQIEDLKAQFTEMEAKLLDQNAKNM